MRVLVTGGAGFIGTHLVQALLQAGDEVLVIDDFSTSDRERLIPVFTQFGPGTCDHVNITDRELLEAWFAANTSSKPLDCIYHLAARASIVPSVKQPRLYHDVNVTGTLNVLEMARRYNVPRFIHAASGSCYGIPRKVPTDEQCPVQPLYPYAMTKLMGEQYALHFGSLYAMRVVSLRLFNVFGPRMCLSGGYGGLFSTILPQYFNGKPVVTIGSGQQKRDFVHVRDVARAFLLAGRHPSPDVRVFNIGSGRNISVNEILHLLHIPDSCLRRLPERPGEPAETQADIRRADAVLGWRPMVSFEEGLWKMVADREYWKSGRVWTYQESIDAQRDWYASFGKTFK